LLARKKEFIAGNYQETRNVLEACLAAGVRRLLHFSSVSVLGHDTKAPVNDVLPPRINPGGYAHSKTLAERLVSEYMSKGLLDITIVYPTWKQYCI
jgi:dihydroflavonol-4-reductase